MGESGFHFESLSSTLDNKCVVLHVRSLICCLTTLGSESGRPDHEKHTSGARSIAQHNFDRSWDSPVPHIGVFFQVFRSDKLCSVWCIFLLDGFTHGG